MRPCVAPRGSVRPGTLLSWFFALVVTCLSVAPAWAGDSALIDFLGYSRDRDHFAFEEYGIQDGSGFAYSSIYIVQLSNDSWVMGTPYHAQADEAQWDKPLAAVRAEARAMAQADLDALHIDNPARILALIGDGAVDTDGRTLRFAEPACCGPATVSEDIRTLKLETFDADTTWDCMGMLGKKGLGYSLTLMGAKGAREVHRDKAKLPKSRGCPTDYRLYAVVEPFQTGGGHVAIVSSFPFGFEGPDRRFLAVPLGD